MKTLVIICVILSGLLIKADDPALTIIRGNAKFGNDLYQIITKKPGNALFSPISTHAILSLAYQGAVGKTAEALKNALYNPSPRPTGRGYKNVMIALNSARNVTLHVANKIFLQETYPLRNSFKSIATSYFLSEAENINFTSNFAAARKINSWAESKTESKIKELIKARDLNRWTRLVLVNAIYFKSDWQHKFNPFSTFTEAFWISEKLSVDCQMMHLTRNFDYTESAELDAKILQIPYANHDLNLVIILPNARDGVRSLETKLAKVDLSTLTAESENVEVHLSLPKFKIETEILLNGPLKKMGLDKIFRRAEFFNMIVTNEFLRVSKAVQKAFIDVNEEGTEAAAATAIIPSFRSFPHPTARTFNADHPFVFMLQFALEKERVILFMGKVARIP